MYFFLPGVILVYTLVPKKYKNSVLLLSSLVFYAWGEKVLVLMLIATIFLGWLFGILIEKTNQKKVLLVVSMMIDLGLLGYYKYADFFIDSFNKAFGGNVPLLKIALPIGISFYTFQILSYTVDVYGGKVKAQKNLIDFATYVALFPQLIAGPIVRYSDLQEQLVSRTHSLEKTACGVRRFVIGLGKKVLIANLMGEFCTFYQSSSQQGISFAWAYGIAFMLQIYYDFSGYSDMAIGLGKMFGFDLIENFNYPYIASSITDFWRRWHISLGSWFRDYVYIPLGGNRKGLFRQIVNLTIVWMLTGLWHGAAWNFVFWGLFFGVLLMIEKMFLLKAYANAGTAGKVFGHIFTLFMVMIGFMIFNASSMAEAFNDIGNLFAFGKLPIATIESVYYMKSYFTVFVIAIVGSTPLPKRIGNRLYESKLGYIEPILLGLILIVTTAYLIDGSFNPFLYFRF